MKKYFNKVSISIVSIRFNETKTYRIYCLPHRRKNARQALHIYLIYYLYKKNSDDRNKPTVLMSEAGVRWKKGQWTQSPVPVKILLGRLELVDVKKGRTRTHTHTHPHTWVHSPAGQKN